MSERSLRDVRMRSEEQKYESTVRQDEGTEKKERCVRESCRRDVGEKFEGCWDEKSN
jgi:hypothetical protein